MSIVLIEYLAPRALFDSVVSRGQHALPRPNCWRHMPLLTSVARKLSKWTLVLRRKELLQNKWCSNCCCCCCCCVKKKNAPCGHNVLSTFSFRDVCVWIHDGMLNTAVFFNCSLLTTLVNRGYVLILIVYPAPSGCVVILTELRPFPLPHFSFRLCYCCFYKKWQKKVPILWFKCCQCKLSLTFDFWRHYWVERHNSNSNCFKSTKKTNMAWFCCWQLIWDDDSDTNKLVQINLSFFFCS